jgi:flagellar motor protein MotB
MRGALAQAPRKARQAVWAVALLALACASAPPPRVLSQLDGVARSPASAQAEKLAPQALLRARRWQEEARQAHERGDSAAAQALGERALAAFDRAFALARLANAAERIERAEANLSAARAELQGLDRAQLRLLEEANALERRIRVIVDAEPRESSDKAVPERVAARRDAARSLIAQGRLLCTAARLLDADAPVSSKLDVIDALAKRVESGEAPIDDAIGARSKCLAELSRIRQVATQKAPEVGAPDALLADLGKLEAYYPFRDDRGVVVTLRDLFDGGALGASGKERVATLARVAAAHARFPVLVVLHSSRGAPTDADRARAERVAEALKTGGAPSVRAEAVGGAQPVVDPKGAGATARNERVEIVFVAPTW